MQHRAFADAGAFYRGNLHTHSTASDGTLDPAEVCRRYADAGYDFIALTDHFLPRFGWPVTDTRGLRTNRFTTVLGAEVHTPGMANGEPWHILAVGLPPDFAPTAEGESAAALARRCAGAGAFVALAHPEWNGLTPEDARPIEAADAVEIYNHGCHIESDRGFGVALLDTLLSEGRRLTACATDDAHFHGPDHFGGWVMVKAEANEPEALLGALKSGAYYASTGPELHDLRVEGDSIRVACSPAARVIAMGAKAASTVVHGDGLTSAELPLAPFRAGGWVRLAVHDAAGRRAWSNPLWLD